MNIAILETIGKWISFIMIGVVSIFSGSVIKIEELESTNLNENKSYNVVNEIIPYDTETIYNEKIPSTITKVVTEGQYGVKTMVTGAEYKVVKEPVTEVVEKGTGAVGEYVGKLTGYGPDCAGCSQTGGLACHTVNRGTHNLYRDGIYYQDQDFGKVRILSAATAFPCGTIIKIDNGQEEELYGVVLDRGGSMNSAWAKGTVWIDLAYASVSDARNGNMSGNNVKFSVQRWGF